MFRDFTALIGGGVFKRKENPQPLYLDLEIMICSNKLPSQMILAIRLTNYSCHNLQTAAAADHCNLIEND